ncbi:MAG: nicotinate (nicotinamide) nucleotide adenylyltransferase [Cytophagaceae bacterium]|nr:nicotinate (nicotinamide) nucleotide adenylyltransferase [Cytophagaceae bacterium]
MKTGLFFGSFNPIHMGHLIIANTMLNNGLEEVWFVISPQNPFKRNSGLLHEFDRYEMARLASFDNTRLKVSDIEFQLPRPSYTVDTLEILVQKYPMQDFVLIMGSDNLQQFENWKNYESILKMVELYVYPRPGSDYRQWKEHPRIHFIESPQLDISATYIRKLIKENKSIQYLVTDDVARYIERKKFFK